MELMADHLCSIDHSLPKGILVDIMEGEDSDDEMESQEPSIYSKVELSKGLDLMCCHFIQYIDRITQKEDKPKTVLALQLLLRDFVPVFEKVFLPQPSTKAVQFILFYLLSLKTSFPDSFIDWLLKRITSPSEPILKRQAAASYLCGLCARAEYIQTSTIIYVVKILIAFCMKYISNIPENKIGTVELQSLNLQAIVFSKLNPLAEMVPAIAAKFADIMKETEILFCHGVLEQTRRERLSLKGVNDCVNPIDFYFPFDECLLPQLRIKIESFYNYWKEPEESEDTDSNDSDMD